MNTVFRILLAESWKQECDSGDVEDDQHTNDVDEDPLTIFLAVIFVAPDCLLQVTHKGGRTGQGQDGWAKILKMRSLDIKTKVIYCWELWFFLDQPVQCYLMEVKNQGA